MEEVLCPGCRRQKFTAVAGSECYCSCGTAFRIIDNQTTELVNMRSSEGKRNQGRVRRFLGIHPAKGQQAKLQR